MQGLRTDEPQKERTGSSDSAFQASTSFLPSSSTNQPFHPHDSGVNFSDCSVSSPGSSSSTGTKSEPDCSQNTSREFYSPEKLTPGPSSNQQQTNVTNDPIKTDFPHSPIAQTKFQQVTFESISTQFITHNFQGCEDSNFALCARL